MSRRISYAAAALILALVLIFIAYFVRDDFIRPYGGDVLITAFICCALRVLFPRGICLMPVLVFLFAAAVEVGQYFRLVDLLGLGHIPFFRTWIGTSFSAADILCYAVGCALFWAVDARISVACANQRRNRQLIDAAESCRGEDGLYHGQRRTPLGEMRFGYYLVSRSGCGPIGICNALRLMGEDVPLHDVITACEWGIPFLGAMVGLSPLTIPAITRWLLRRAGRRDLRVRLRIRQPAVLPPDSVMILTYFNGKKLKDGAHTVAVYGDGEGICVANAYNTSRSAACCASIDAYLRGRRMLCAVIIASKNK